MIDGITKKSEIIKGYINQREVQLVDQEVDIHFLEKKLIGAPHHQWKELNDNLTKAKSQAKDIKEVLSTMYAKLDEYLKEESKDTKKAEVGKKS